MKTSKDRYRYWDIYDDLPDGWKIDKTCGSPMARAVFITDGVPPLYGCKRALLRLKIEHQPTEPQPQPQPQPNPTQPIPIPLFQYKLDI
jgi:hypothetical protein